MVVREIGVRGGEVVGHGGEGVVGNEGKGHRGGVAGEDGEDLEGAHDVDELVGRIDQDAVMGGTRWEGRGCAVGGGAGRRVGACGRVGLLCEAQMG